MPSLQDPRKQRRPPEKRKPGVEAVAADVGSSLETYILCLYVSGSTIKSARAIENLKRICEQHLPNRYKLEVIDVYQQPDLVRLDQIVAVPTLIRRLPLPLRRLIGDLSTTENVLLGLDLNKGDR